ncbi:sperm motility kinase X-like [Apodemus sylvaticus]|uniref:sperm motility kinase X-like n=1 Tax=Apodemus sylvaticus TaxID=10129 RepID=UPI002243ECBD|nr:sperm motility kinase X-like [Apodemus sylvaticus]
MSGDLKASCHEGNPLAQHYYILGTLDKGSFAEVKVALHLMTQTMVAIKILKRGTNIDFLVISEIDLVKSLNHSRIIQLFQIFETRHKTYLVMEYAVRGSLLKHINKCGHLDEEEARRIFTELSLAVNYIHSQNIVHRDIKAENILLDWEGHVKLTDFGLGKRLASGEKFKGFCGTPQYCAPEVFDHKQYDGLPTDIWSLDMVQESSSATDTSSSMSSWESRTSSPSPIEKNQEENIGIESLQDTSSSSRETVHQEQLRRRSQGMPRVPLRKRAWRGLKKRISKSLKELVLLPPSEK